MLLVMVLAQFALAHHDSVHTEHHTHIHAYTDISGHHDHDVPADSQDRSDHEEICSICLLSKAFSIAAGTDTVTVLTYAQTSDYAALEKVVITRPFVKAHAARAPPVFLI